MSLTNGSSTVTFSSLTALGRSIFYPHPPYGGFFLVWSTLPCRNLQNFAIKVGSESAIKGKEPIGIAKIRKFCLLESGFSNVIFLLKKRYSPLFLRVSDNSAAPS